MKIKFAMVTVLLLFLMSFVLPINSISYADSETKKEVQPIIPIIVKTQSHGEGGW